MNRGVNTAHEAIVADGNTHLSVHHKGNAAEHSSFFDALNVLEACSHALCQGLVEWFHGVLLTDDHTD